MSAVDNLKLAPVFLSDNSGQPAWAVLPYDQYQQLLASAGLNADVSGAAELNTVAPKPAPTPSAVPNATAQLLASLAENAKKTRGEQPLSFNPKKLQSCREAAPMSLADLARSAGISPSYVAMMEQGERDPSGPILNSFARALGIEVDALLGE